MLHTHTHTHRTVYLFYFTCFFVRIGSYKSVKQYLSLLSKYLCLQALWHWALVSAGLSICLHPSAIGITGWEVRNCHDLIPQMILSGSNQRTKCPLPWSLGRKKTWHLTNGNRTGKTKEKKPEDKLLLNLSEIMTEWLWCTIGHALGRGRYAFTYVHSLLF